MALGQPLKFDAIKIPFAENAAIIISAAGLKNPEGNLQLIEGLPSGWTGQLSSSEKTDAPILYHPVSHESGRNALVLFEIQRYFWTLSLDVTAEPNYPPEITSSLLSRLS